MTDRSPRRRKRMIWILAAIGLLMFLLLAAALMLAFTVDDWSRDLTSNHAATSETAANDALRPIFSSRAPDELARIVVAAVAEMPQWEHLKTDAQDDDIVLSLVRSTKLMRFQDDVTVTIAATSDGGSRLDAASRSRVGVGDLGQNPRNLIELLSAIRRRLGEKL